MPSRSYASVAGSQLLPDDLKVRMASEAIAVAMRFGQLLDFIEHPDEGDTRADDDAQKQQRESRGCEHGEHRSCNVSGVPFIECDRARRPTRTRAPIHRDHHARGYRIGSWN